MKKASRLLIASLASFAFAGTAAAEDVPAADGEAAAEPAPDGMAPDPNAAPMTTDPNAMAAPAVGRWPRQVILRPLTLPAGLFMVEVDIVNLTSSFFDPAFIGVGVGYGITDQIELGLVGYFFPTSDVGKGDIAANLGYNLVRGGSGGKLDAAARLSLGYDLLLEGLDPLGLGVQVRYLVNDKIAVYTPGEQLQIGLEEPNPISFNLPVGVALQATPELYAFLQTDLLNLAIKEGESTFIFADTTPLTLGAVYNVMPALDIMASIATDLSNSPFDPAAILVGARYYGGKLN